MKGFLYFFLFSLFSLFIANNLVDNPGYVLINFKENSFESSLWAFIILIIISFLCILILKKIINIIICSSNLVYPLSIQAKKKTTLKLRNKAIIEMICGSINEAQQYFLKAFKLHDDSLITGIMAAKTCFLKQDLKQAEYYLKQIKPKSSKEILALDIFRADLKLKVKEYSDAEAILELLHKKFPKNTLILSLLKKSYTMSQNWTKMFQILPKIKEIDEISDEKYESIEIKTIKSLFDIAINAYESINKNKESINTIWQKLTNTQKKKPDILAIYINSLIKTDSHNKAYDVIKKNIALVFSKELALLYSQINSKNLNSQLHDIDVCLQEYPLNSYLFLTAARLSVKLKLWGKAKKYYKQSIQLNKNIDSYYELAQVYLTLNDIHKSNLYLQKGLSLVAHKSTLQLKKAN